MASINIFWTQTAIRQRDSIFEYWNERNNSYDYSEKLYLKINERAAILKKNPEIGKPTEYKNTRVVSLGHYSIFYQFNSKTLLVTGFWDNRQDPSKLLKFLNQIT